MKKIFQILVTTIIMLSMFISCDDRGPDTAGEADIVATEYNEEAKDNGDFSSASTVLIPPYVTDVSDSGFSRDTPSSGSIDQEILDQLSRHFIDRGYTVTSDTTEITDLVVTSYKFSNWNISYATYWPDWWWGYWGYSDWWYDPYNWGGGYYPGYWGYPYTVSYAYETGSILIEIVDNRNVITDSDNENIKRKPIIWAGVTNGILTNTYDELNRIDNAIDQMFKQSPYIIKK